MANVSIDIYNLGSKCNPISDTSFQDIITKTCLSWRNYSTNAHELYIILFWIIFGFGILNKIFPIPINWEKTVNTKYRIIKRFGLNKFEAHFFLFDYLRNITISVLLIRIFQIYYISKLYLGGV